MLAAAAAAVKAELLGADEEAGSFCWYEGEDDSEPAVVAVVVVSPCELASCS